MSGLQATISKERWDELLQHVTGLPAERQEEILDYIAFILERADPEAWDLSEAEAERMARHRAGDVRDTVALEDVEDAIRRGALDEL